MFKQLSPVILCVLLSACGSSDVQEATPIDMGTVETFDRGSMTDGSGGVTDMFVSEVDTSVQPDMGESSDATPTEHDAQTPDSGTSPPVRESAEHAFIMRVPQQTPDWRDLAYLATVSASSHLNLGRPTVIAVDGENGFDGSAHDFLTRYRANRITVLGLPNIQVDHENVEHGPLEDLVTHSLSMAAYWESTSYIVVVPTSEYGTCLMGASLAARLDAPLFFIDGAADDRLITAIENLAPQAVITMGLDADLGVTNQVSLTDSDDVIRWLLGQNISTDYLALVNPNDRGAGRSQKLSLTASAYTARRAGLTIPFATQIPADVAVGTDLTATLAHLSARYHTLGHHPEHLALVGSFDIIPINRTNSLFDVPEHEWPVNDLPYGDIDADPFRDIAVGRIFTDSLYRGSLLAARSVNYERLKDGVWNNRFVESGLWGFDELRAIMTNVGFEPPEHLSEGQINGRATLEVAAFLHKDHSHCTVLGNAITLQTPTLYAPAVVLSRGCSVAGIDLVPVDAPTVPGNMLGQGAIAFVGAPRNSIAGNTVTEVAFFNHLLAGQTLGQAMRSALNNATVHYLDENSDAGMRYVLDNEMLFGDPGLQFTVPAPPTSAPAFAERRGDQVIVTAPEMWTRVQFVPEQLAEWNYDEDLFMYVGPGAEPKTYWSGRYDTEDLYYTVALQVDESVISIEAITAVDHPLGWQGNYYRDGHQDGTETLRWRVRLLDYDMQTGNLSSQIDTARYRLLR